MFGRTLEFEREFCGQQSHFIPGGSEKKIMVSDLGIKGNAKADYTGWIFMQKGFFQALSFVCM